MTDNQTVFVNEVVTTITITEPTSTPSVVETVTEVIVADLGIQGVAGGIAGFTFYQATALAVWTIHHNLGGYPIPIVFDSANNECLGLVSYTDQNTMVITFTSAFSGTAYLN